MALRAAWKSANAELGIDGGEQGEILARARRALALEASVIIDAVRPAALDALAEAGPYFEALAAKARAWSP